MNKKELLETVNALTEQFNTAQLDELEVETEGLKVKISKHPSLTHISTVPTAPVTYPTAQINDENNTNTAQTPKPLNGKIIKSPIIGTFYAAAAPGKSPFVAVGGKVKKGDVVCIVESMKLMNEINSEYDGVIAEIFVNDGQPVEYDQPLFRLD